MMEARATVLRVADGRVWLRLEDRPGGCGRCDEPGGCRATRLADAFKLHDELVCLRDTLGSRVGDGVWIAVPERAPLRAALLGYVLPLGLMLTLGAVGLLLAPFASADANVLAGVAAGLLAGVLAGRRIMAIGALGAAMELRLRPLGADGPACGGRP